MELERITHELALSTLLGDDSNWDRSPSRDCPHEAFPFVEAPAKAKLAGSIETQPGDHLAALSAFRIFDVPIMAARKKDVGRQRVVFCFHCRKLGLDITYSRNADWAAATALGSWDKRQGDRGAMSWKTGKGSEPENHAGSFGPWPEEYE
jgi:hypothetical protein